MFAATVAHQCNTTIQSMSVTPLLPVRVLLCSTAMVRAEPIKKEEYLGGRIQRKVHSQLTLSLFM